MLKQLQPLALASFVSVLALPATALGGGSPRATSGEAASTAAPAATPSRIATVMIRFKKRQWRRGDLPTMTVSVTGDVFAGVTPQKVGAFLYQSFDPNPFANATAVDFVGVLPVPSENVIPVYLNPERNPITEFTRERFVQVAVFNLETEMLEGVSNVAYLDIDYAAAAEEFTIDFSTEDDFTTPLANGQDISTPPEFGNLFDILSDDSETHFGPAIFDTTPGVNLADPDLHVDLGNALILQGHSTQSQPGFFDIPNDSAFGGRLTFDFGELQFTRHATVTSLDLIDMCLEAQNSAVITLTDVLGHEVVYTVPPGWTTEINSEGPPGFGTLDLTTLDPQPGFLSTATAVGDEDFIQEECVRVDIELSGSGAVDNFHFEREADPFQGGAPQSNVPRRRIRRTGSNSLRTRHL